MLKINLCSTCSVILMCYIAFVLPEPVRQEVDVRELDTGVASKDESGTKTLATPAVRRLAMENKVSILLYYKGVLKSYQPNQEGNDLEPLNLHIIPHIPSSYQNSALLLLLSLNHLKTSSFLNAF